MRQRLLLLGKGRRFCADGGEKGVGGGRESCVSAPGEIDVADERGRERTEDDTVGELLRDHPVDADRRAESRLDEDGRVVDEVVVGDHVQLPERAAEPSGEKLLHHRLTRTDERNPSRVLRRDAFLRGERRILPDGKPPMVRVGQRQVVEAVVASGADQHAKVEGPFAQVGDDVLAVA